MITALAPADGEAILPLVAVQARVRVIGAADAADIARMRLEAIDFVERYVGKALSRRQFLWEDRQFCHAMRAPIGPVVSIDAISYFDREGADIPLDSAAWRLGGGFLYPAVGTRWPYALGDEGSVRVTLTAGFEDAEAEAPMLVAAVCVGIAQLYDNRDDPDWEPVRNCARSYKRWVA